MRIMQEDMLGRLGVGKTVPINTNKSRRKCIRCLRRPCFEASVLDPTCIQNVASVFGQYVHPPADRNE